MGRFAHSFSLHKGSLPQHVLWDPRRDTTHSWKRFAVPPSESTTPGTTFREAPAHVFQQLLLLSTTTSSTTDDAAADIGMQELQQWPELQELIAEDDLTQTELEDMVADSSTGSSTKNKHTHRLDLAGFCALYQKIDDLFEYDDVDADNEPPEDQLKSDNNQEEELLSFLEKLQTTVRVPLDLDPTMMMRMPCGMECTDQERDVLSAMVSDLESSPNNRVVQQNGQVDAKDVLGEWELLYTNSKAMITNKSLSGLVGTPTFKAEWSGVRQKLTGSKFLGYVEFVETFNAGTDSFQVQITGEWELQPNRHYFTGDPGTMMKVDPMNIEYGAGYAMAEEAPVLQLGGGLSQAASWQSLGPIKLLDIIYLTNDVWISRGNTKTEVIFVWKRCA